MSYATVDPVILRAVMWRQNRRPNDVAAAVDVSARRLQYILSGQHVTTSTALVDALARELNVPPCVLVTDGEAPRFRLADVEGGPLTQPDPAAPANDHGTPVSA